VLGSWNGCRGGSLFIKFCGVIRDFVDLYEILWKYEILWIFTRFCGDVGDFLEICEIL